MSIWTIFTKLVEFTTATMCRFSSWKEGFFLVCRAHCTNSMFVRRIIILREENILQQLSVQLALPLSNIRPVVLGNFSPYVGTKFCRKSIPNEMSGGGLTRISWFAQFWHSLFSAYRVCIDLPSLWLQNTIQYKKF